MFTLLKRKAPDINIADYITFHSLKSWGIINNKVVSDQVMTFLQDDIEIPKY